MRTLLASLVCIVLVACTPDTPSEDPIVSDATPSLLATATPDPVATLEPTNTCEGLGRVPRAGQITLIEDYELRAFTPSGGPPRCLMDLEGPAFYGNVIPPSWNARGDAVILRDRTVSKDLSVTARLTDRQREVPEWSRPEGTSVVYVTTKGELKKRPSTGGPAKDLSFLARHDAVTYHPAGLHIATSGLTADGSYGLYLATNLGTEPELLARGEAARFITNLSFSQDGLWLYYTARHGPRDWHLHRLSIGPGATLETLDLGENDYEYVLSPFESDLYAWFAPGDCAAGEAGSFKSSGARIDIPPEMRLQNIHPVGWLPGRRLVVRVATTGCSTAQPGDVYVLSDQEPVLIDEENYGNVSVRVRYPGPPPPPGEEQEVVA